MGEPCLQDIRNIALFIIILLMIAFPMDPSCASADIERFVPKIFDYGGELEVNMTYENNDEKSDGRRLTTQDLFLRERLNLFMNGYIYHPRFIQYLLKLSGGLKEEDFSSTGTGAAWSTGTSSEYEFRALILPEHPYNLELFTLRQEPLARQGFARSVPTIAYSKGAIFKYKRKPYYVTMSYLNNRNESSVNSFDTTVYNLLGTYYKEYSEKKILSISTQYRHTNSTTSTSSFSGASDEASLAGGFFLKNFSFSSSVGLNSSKQESIVLPVTDTVFLVSESLNARLPWNFDGLLAYSFQEDTFTIGGTRTSPETKTTNDTHNASFQLTHQLYNSLQTNYSFNYMVLNAPTGESKTYTNSLGLNYSKHIPGGILHSGISASRYVTDSTGITTIPNEAHTAVTVPGFFLLGNQNIDETTIMVFLRNPEVPLERIPLTKNINYAVTAFGKTFQIDILNLPAPFIVPGTYDFIVSYSLIPENAQIETTTLSYNINLDLFNNLLYPYYTHVDTKQKVLSGTIEGQPVSETTDTVGLIVTKMPYVFLAEYQDLRSNINPSKTWRAELNYTKTLALTSQINARAHYAHTNYPQGTGGPGSIPYTDTSYGADVGIQKRFPTKNITVSTSGSYSRRQALSTSTVYSLNANLTWDLGRQFYLYLGGTASFSQSESVLLTDKRLNQYYYMTLKRKLF